MLTLRTLAQKFTFLLMVMLLSGLATNSDAADNQRYYDIEMVIFQNNDALKTLPELIPEPQPLKMPEHYIQLGSPDPNPPAEFIPDYYFRLLPDSDYQLSNAAAKIAASKKYRLLTHLAWRQPGLESSVAVPVYFQQTILPETAPATTAPADAAGQAATTPPLYTQATLQGLITVSLSRYLHVETTLRFEADGLAPLPAPAETIDVPVAATEAVVKTRPTSVVYVTTQSRRMRSKELHYIDHPVIGMLVLITPVDVPKQPAKSPTRRK